jgi:hypothetical protein
MSQAAAGDFAHPTGCGTIPAAPVEPMRDATGAMEHEGLTSDTMGLYGHQPPSRHRPAA